LRKVMILTSIVGVLLIAGFAVTASGFSAPLTKEQEVTRIKYEMKEDFSQQAVGFSTKRAKTANPVFFPKIIDSVTGTYACKFQSDVPVSDLQQQFQVTAVLTNPGTWEKEVVLVEPTPAAESINVSFPLDLNSLMKLSEDISKELGLGSGSTTMVLKAAVQTTGKTSSGPFQDYFVQTCQLGLTPTVMQWQKPFDYTRKGYQNGTIYQHSGVFGYSIKMKPNSIFGASTIDSGSPRVEPVRQLTVANNYAADSIQTLNLGFSSKLTADRTLEGVKSDVGISAVLASPDAELADFTLVPKRQINGDVLLKAPIDIDLMYDIIKAAENSSIKDIQNTYQLVVKADVHTVARNGSNTIDKTVSSSIPITLGPERVEWPAATSNSLADAIKEKVVVSNTARTTGIVSGLGILGMAIAVGIWASQAYLEFKRRKPFMKGRWAADQRILSKYKGIITTVGELPEKEMSGKVTILDSLEELVRLADNLLKPVLHRSEEEREIYYILDSSFTYVYLGPKPPTA
jgi:hypothetical protein